MSASKHIVPIVSFVPDDGSLVEMIHDGEETAFVQFQKGKLSVKEKIQSKGTIFVPYRATNNIIRNRVVLFPSEALPYGSPEDLLSEIRWYLHRYVDVSPAYERIASAYVLLTWLYDCFNELPYLRLRGDYGTGKTRFLLVVGSICYKPIFASGASTVSPLFHLLDSFRGTLLIDEADFRYSDEKADIVKLLNQGNVKGLPVLRTRVTPEREYNPRAFSVFGPKIVATRGHYYDTALESRFIAEEMGTRPLRRDIPISLPNAQQEEAQTLRNKLLMYRFYSFHKTTTKPHFFHGKVEPRLKQIFVPLMSVIDDPKFADELEALAVEYTRQIALDRGFEIEPQVLTAIRATGNEGAGVPIKGITNAFNRLYSEEVGERVTPRWIGGLVRRRLKLTTHKSNGNYVIPLQEAPKIVRLFEKYGVDAPDPHAENGDLPTIEA